jgi:hypothetical protein
MTTEPSGMISWPVPDQPTTTPPSMRIFITHPYVRYSDNFNSIIEIIPVC